MPCPSKSFNNLLSLCIHSILGVCLCDRMRKCFQTKLSCNVGKTTIVLRRFFPLPMSNATAAASHRGQRWVTKSHRVGCSCPATLTRRAAFEQSKGQASQPRCTRSEGDILVGIQVSSDTSVCHE